MKYIDSVIRGASKLLHGQFLRMSLKPAGFMGLLLALSFLFSSGSPPALASPQHPSGHTPVLPPAEAGTHTDIIFIIDNISYIKAFDPSNARFIAAQMLVNQAQYGSRFGVVSLSSSDNPTPKTLLNLTTIRSNDDKKAVRQVLNQNFFGPVDPGPDAFFVPSLQMASQMLLSAQDTNQKYIVVMADAQAQSADQEPCQSAPDQFHQWLCVIPTLQSEKISVILFGFTTPANPAMPRSLQQFLQQYGGTTLQVG